MRGHPLGRTGLNLDALEALDQEDHARWLDAPDAAMSRVSVSCRLAPATRLNDAARELLKTHLEQALWGALRQQRGLSYLTEVTSVYYPGGTSFLQMDIVPHNEQVVPALLATLGHLKALARGEAQDAALNRSKWTLARQSRMRHGQVDDVLSTLIRQVHFGHTLEALSGYGRRLALTKAEDLATLLEPCIGREAISVVGPAHELQPRLEGASLPPTQTR